MELKRKPLQGVGNIIRFNWPFYVAAFSVIIAIVFFKHHLPGPVQSFVFVLALLAGFTILVSLLVSFYVYDVSNLYQLNWLPGLNHKKVLTINAGFDETSAMIKTKYPNSELVICDFFDPEKHTEASIKRARAAYPPSENTIRVTTAHLPFAHHAFDEVLAILSAHEIRDAQERIGFFKELHRVTKPGGRIFVTEHVRDLNNFIAYTIGFFHFHSKADWLHTFNEANLSVKQEIKTTPFITTFMLEKHGNTL
jgi:SAM-dependent methyltransferase